MAKSTTTRADVLEKAYEAGLTTVIRGAIILVVSLLLLYVFTLMQLESLMILAMPASSADTSSDGGTASTSAAATENGLRHQLHMSLVSLSIPHHLQNIHRLLPWSVARSNAGACVCHQSTAFLPVRQITCSNTGPGIRGGMRILRKHEAGVHALGDLRRIRAVQDIIPMRFRGVNARTALVPPRSGPRAHTIIGSRAEHLPIHCSSLSAVHCNHPPVGAVTHASA